MKPEPKPSITHHSVETSPDEVLNYWTPEKMQNTTTTNMPNVDTLEGTKPHPRRLPRLFRRGRNK